MTYLGYMRQLLFTLLCCLPVTFCFSQKDEKFTISLTGSVSSEKLSLPFSALTVIDARFDKSNIGTVANDFSFKGMTKNKMEAGFPDLLHNYLPVAVEELAMLNKATPDTVLMLVKQFRLADHLFNTMDTYHAPETVLTFSVSFYKKAGGQLLKLFSLTDTWSKVWNEVNDKEANEIIFERKRAITDLLARIFQNRDWTPTATGFSLSDMEIGLQKRFQLPLFTDASLKPGLYKSFEEFKNNNPSVTNVHFQTSKGEVTDIVNENKTSIEVSDYWGACDGRNLYIAFKGSFGQLQRSDKSFKFLATRQEVKNGGIMSNKTKRMLLWGPAITRIARGPGIRTNQEYYYVNMENGRIHLEEVTGTQRYETAIKSLNYAGD